MKKPVLVIMAAGMGSRYGGLKQIDPVDEYGNIIMDFSVYAAREAGFEKVIFVIKRENEEAFEETIGRRLRQHMETEYVYQELEDLPEGYSVPEGRKKPWGTAHAVLSAMPAVDGPFAVINADDYYGKEAFASLYAFLTRPETEKEKGTEQFAMVAFSVENTLTENGTVSRGLCELDEAGRLLGVTERTKIRRTPEGAAFTEDGGASWTAIEPGTLASMNFWGFTEPLMRELKQRFAAFLEENLEKNGLGCEYFLPTVVSELIEEKRASVTVLRTEDSWFGVTYQEDKPAVVAAIRRQKEAGLYPEKLWE